MDFTIKQAALVRELSYLQQTVQRKSTLPVTSRVRIFASASHRVQFNATDLDVWIETGADANVRESGVVSLPARLLYQVAKAMPHADIVMRSDGPRIGVSAGDFTANITRWDAADYPMMPKRGSDPVVLAVESLREMVRRCRGSVGREVEGTKAALLEFRTNDTRMVATNGYRMTLVTTPPVGVTGTHLLLEKTLSDLEGLLEDDAKEAAVYFGTDVLSFSVDGRLLDVTPVISKFPPFEPVLALPFEDVASIKRDDFMVATKRMVSLAGETEGIVLSGDAGTLTLDVGEASEPVPTESFSGAPFSMRIQGGYLVDALAVADELVTISIVRGEGKGVRPLQLTSLSHGCMYQSIIAQTTKTEPKTKKK